MNNEMELSNENKNIVVGFVCTLILIIGIIVQLFAVMTQFSGREDRYYLYIIILAFGAVIVLWQQSKKMGTFGHMVLCVTMIIVMLAASTVTLDLANFVRTKLVSEDMNILVDNTVAIEELIQNLEYDPAQSESRQTYEALCKGAMITNWDNSTDELQRQILGRLRACSFQDYCYYFKSVQGRAMVYVKITDGQVYMRLVNPWMNDYVLEKSGNYYLDYLRHT